MYKKSVLNNKIVLLLFIIPIFTPQSFDFFIEGILGEIFLRWNVVNTIILFLIFLMRKKLKRSYSWSIISFWLLFLICSLITSNDLMKSINTWIGTAAPIINFMLLSNIIFKYNSKNYINLVSKYLFFLLSLNLILLIIFSHGVVSLQHVFTDGRASDSFKRVNFMATDNTTIQFLIVTILFSELRYYFCKVNSLFRKLTWIISGLTAVIIWSGTGIVGYLVFLLSSAIFVFPRGEKLKFSINSVYLFGIISFFIIVVFRLQSLFSFFIVGVLGKDVSLSNRIYIWDIAYSKILQRPLLGWGNNSKGWIIEYNWYNYYAHNLVLDILIQGGIITMLGMYFILNHSRVSLSRQRDKYLESLLSCCILSIFTMNITESQFTSAYFYIPFILAWLLSTYNPNSTRINHKKLLS